MLLGLLCVDFPTCKLGLVANTPGLQKPFSPVRTLFSRGPTRQGGAAPKNV